jgi:hypothetical protein
LNTENTELYVAGDFNSWTLDKDSELNYNSNTGLWSADVLIKEGNYRYKYFQKYENSANSTAIPINDSITNRRQSYHSFVYYLDPEKNYQRLLIIGSFNSGN